MKIVVYDDVDPFDVLDLNVLCFNFALTPGLVSKIRRLDSRPFPFFALYAVDQDRVVGQAVVFQVTTDQGPLEAGAIWAMCTHPAYSQQGIDSALIEEAHRRMRSAGFKVTRSTLDVTMIKPLRQAMTLEQLYQLFDVASGRFMMSGFDVT